MGDECVCGLGGSVGYDSFRPVNMSVEGLRAYRGWNELKRMSEGGGSDVYQCSGDGRAVKYGVRDGRVTFCFEMDGVLPQDCIGELDHAPFDFFIEGMKSYSLERKRVLEKITREWRNKV